MADKPLDAKERALIRAIGNEDFDAVHQLIVEDGVNANIQDSLQRTPILRACFISDKAMRTAISQLLIDKGADVNLTERHGRTALMTACMEDAKEEMVALIVGTSNVDANRQDEEGNTALMHAVMIDNVAAVRVLLSEDFKNKINCEMKNFQDQTPLLVAAKQQSTEICELLVREGGAKHEEIPSYLKQNLPEECQEKKEEKAKWDSLFKSYRENSLEANIVQRSAMHWKGNQKKKKKPDQKNAKKAPLKTDHQKPGDEPQKREKHQKENIVPPSEIKKTAADSDKEEKNDKTSETQLFFKVDVEGQERRKSDRRRSGGEELVDDGKKEEMRSSSAAKALRSYTQGEAPPFRAEDDDNTPSRVSKESERRDETKSNSSRESTEIKESGKENSSKTSTTKSTSSESQKHDNVSSSSSKEFKETRRPSEEETRQTEQTNQSRQIVTEEVIVASRVSEVQHVAAESDRQESREDTSRISTAKSVTRQGASSSKLSRQAEESENTDAIKEEGREIASQKDEKYIMDKVPEHRRDAETGPTAAQSTRTQESTEQITSEASIRVNESRQSVKTRSTEKSSVSLRSSDSSAKRKVSPTSLGESSRPTTTRSTKSVRSNKSRSSDGDVASLAPTESSMKRGAWIRPPPDMIRLQEEADEKASLSGKASKKVKIKKEDQPVYETRSGRIIRPNVCSDPQYTKIQAAKLKIVTDDKQEKSLEKSSGRMDAPSFEKPRRKKKAKRKQDTQGEARS